jgi:DMSO/TMAO reductase YedYZ heme-binding membrane subunit
MRHKSSKLILALGFSAVCFLWSRLGVYVYYKSMVEARNEGLPLVDTQFIVASIIWFAILSALLLASLWSWRRLLRCSVGDVK